MTKDADRQSNAIFTANVTYLKCRHMVRYPYGADRYRPAREEDKRQMFGILLFGVGCW